MYTKTLSVRGHQMWVRRSKRAISATVDFSSIRTVADRRRLAAYRNKHCWRPFLGYQYRLLWTTVKSKIAGFWWIFRDYRLRRTFKEWIFTEITGDRRRQPAHEIKL